MDRAYFKKCMSLGQQGKAFRSLGVTLHYIFGLFTDNGSYNSLIETDKIYEMVDQAYLWNPFN